MPKEFNRHHLIPSSKGGITNKYNVQQTEIGAHTRWHTRCGNDTPVEAICRVLLFNDKVWSENFKADLMAVLDNYLNNYYNPKAYEGLIKSEVQRVLELERI